MHGDGDVAGDGLRAGGLDLDELARGVHDLVADVVEAGPARAS
jgi:hypothetical protein